ncbi:hypothetical protein ACIGJO_25915 [Streptomyces sp. NPDC079020]|uniref:hypothetical protein n=1 Tax=Streptomyces sp. NPDC079020 TaxID=3365722 RepID=UPI0037D7A5FB
MDSRAAAVQEAVNYLAMGAVSLVWRQLGLLSASVGGFGQIKVPGFGYISFQSCPPHPERFMAG